MDPAEQPLPSHNPACFVCGPENAGGLHAQRTVRDDRVVVRFTPTPTHQGAAGIIHGGVLSAVFDEAMGAVAPALLGHTCVTGTLTVTYRKPAYVGTELVLEAWLDRVDGRKVHIGAEAVAGGITVAEATSVFIAVPASHFDGPPAF